MEQRDYISNSFIKELSKRAGITRLSRLSYEEIRYEINNILDNWMRDIITYTKHNHKRTIGIKEVTAGIPHKYYSKLLTGKKCKKSNKKSPAEQIAHYQNIEDCLSIGKRQFERIVRKIVRDYDDNLRFSAEAMMMLQHCLEKYVVYRLSNGKTKANLSKRVTVNPNDIHLPVYNDNCGTGSLSVEAPEFNFDIYIKRVLDYLSSVSGKKKRMSKNALYQLNQFINLLGKAIVEKAFFLNSNQLHTRVKKTISPKEIQSAIRIILPNELCHHAISEGTKAITNFGTASPREKQRQTMQEKAGLKFSVARTSKFFDKYDTRVGQNTPVYLAAVLEYITAELLELCQNVVSTRELKLVIDNDDELKKLCNALCFDIEDDGV